MHEGYPEPTPQAEGDLSSDSGIIVDAEIVETEGPAVNRAASVEPYDPNAVNAEIVDEAEEAARRKREQHDVGETAVGGSGLFDGLSARLLAAAASRARNKATPTGASTTPSPKPTPPKETKEPTAKKPHEKPRYQNYEGPFGPAKQVVYTPDEAGEAQLADHYNTAGIKIEWDRPDTSTGDPWNASERRAVITTADNKRYYLHGATLYDVGVSGEAQRPRTMGNTKMPDVTIGQATMFSNGQEVTSITIATEKVRVENLDPRIRVQPKNTFTELDGTIDQFQQGKQRREKQAPPRHEEPVTSGSNLLGEPASYAYSFRDHRTIAGAVTNLQGRWNDLDENVPLQTSQHGVAISPRATISPPKYDLEKVTDLYGESSDREKAALRRYMQEVDDTADQKFVDARTKEYNPRKETRLVKALQAKLASRRARNAGKPKRRLP